MAKGQKKSNKEVRKPKATKTAAPLATSNLMEKGLVMPGSGGKKK